MKRLVLLAGGLSLALAGCENTDPVGSPAPSPAEAEYTAMIDAALSSPAPIATPRSMEFPPTASAETARSTLANGSFETGDFAGWSAQSTGAPFVPWTVSPAGDGSGFSFAPTEPQDGDFVAWNGFDGVGPMEFTLQLDIRLGGSPLPTLTWSDRAQWDFTLGDPATQPRLVELQILDPESGVVLATPYSFETGLNPTGDTGWQDRMADLAAFRGQTIRISFRQVIPEAFTGPGQYEIDAVNLDGVGSGSAKFLPSAEVLNPGESTDAGFCRFSGRVADRATFVRTPRGGGTLSCQWDAFEYEPELEDALVIKDVGCFLNFGGLSTLTDDGRFVLAPSRTAMFTCQFANVF